MRMDPFGIKEIFVLSCFIEVEKKILFFVVEQITRQVTGMRHLPYEERLQPMGIHILQRRRLRDELITAFKIFKGLLDIDPNLFFHPPARRRLRGHPFKVLQGASHRRRTFKIKTLTQRITFNTNNSHLSFDYFSMPLNEMNLIQ